MKSGSPVTNFTIAVNRRTKQDDSVDHIDVVAWDKLAEISNAYLTKGMPVLVEGRLAIRSYESKSGEKQYSRSHQLVVADAESRYVTRKQRQH